MASHPPLVPLVAQHGIEAEISRHIYWSRSIRFLQVLFLSLVADLGGRGHATGLMEGTLIERKVVKH